MNTEHFILLIGLISLITSGLAIGLGFFSVYQLKKKYPDYQINWYKDITLWIIWTLIFIVSFGLLEHKNWGRIGLIIGLSLLFITIIVITAIKLIGYVIFNLNDSQSNQKSEQDSQEILGENNYQFYSEDLDELNYNEATFPSEKDLDELNLYNDEGDDDEIYYLDNLSEDEERFNDNSETYSFQSSLKNYARQGLIVTTIMAFITDLIIFTLIAFLKSPAVQVILIK